MNINDIRKNIIGDYGLASSNKYQFSFSRVSNALLVAMGKQIPGYRGLLSDAPINYENPGSITTGVKLSYLCDELNIPGYSVATGDLKGLVPGINARYAHTKVYNELSLTFLMDMDHIPYKLMQNWSDFMFTFEQFGGDTSKVDYMITQYYDDYCVDFILEKIEPNADIGNNDRNSLNSRVTHNSTSKILIYNAFPYTMSNLSFGNGPNQPVKLQVSFYYQYLKMISPSPKAPILPPPTQPRR
jgi:hypothetical protein